MPTRRWPLVAAAAALVAVAISLLLSWAVARTVTRPLAALTDGMKQVAATGDLTRKIGPGRPWDDEDARLVARTFNILTEYIKHFRRFAHGGPIGLAAHDNANKGFGHSLIPWFKGSGTIAKGGGAATVDQAIMSGKMRSSSGTI